MMQRYDRHIVSTVCVVIPVFMFMYTHICLVYSATMSVYNPPGQFARVVKGVDLRSIAGNCAWARTPQLTFSPAMQLTHSVLHSEQEDHQPVMLSRVS